MDALRPGHAHRSMSDRLLNNYLDSQKSLSTSLLTLLSHSHASTSSLLAYVTSSPGVVHPVRRSVRHAGFEGPLSAALIESHGGSHVGSTNGDTGSPGWAAYLSSLEQFRKDLKQIHQLEEELSRVKRDREILVTRLIKTTKSRPTKSDLSAIANSYQNASMSSRASSLSVTSNGSNASKEGKRAGKLAEAQAELLGCEEHLRALEVRIENERNKVMLRGLEERFHAMETVGRMWIGQAKRGLEDLDKIHELPADAFEVDSNGSIAPSQSASQSGYEDRPRRGVPFPKMPRHIDAPGSITGSIAEEDENSSDDEGNLVVHENRPGGGTRIINNQQGSTAGRATPKPSPLGVPSVNTRTRPLSSLALGSDFNSRAGGRRAASDIGAGAYNPPKGRTPLRRTFSDDRNSRGSPSPVGRRAGSDTSSINQQRKKKGFFASIGRFFKGPSRKREGSIRSGRDSPPYGSGSRAGGGWHTRTDSNIKRASTFGGSRKGRGNDSSSDEEGGNLVSVSNNRNSTWSVENMGRPQSAAAGSIKRNSNLPVASGLIPKPTRSDLGANKRNSSQSTVRATSPVPSGKKTPTPGMKRSNTVGSVGAKSTTSAGVKSTTTTGTARSGTIKKKTQANGAIARANADSQQAAAGRNIMSLVDMKTPPTMPEVPKAPKSQVTPQLELPKAPGSSLIPSNSISRSSTTAGPNRNSAQPTLARSNSPRQATDTDTPRATTPLPPSRTLQPPLKSALRPHSPTSATADLAPALPLTSSMFSISAPGPIDVQREELKPVAIPQAAHRSVSETARPPSASARPVSASARPINSKKNSYHSMTTDGESVYESAVGDEDQEEQGRSAEAAEQEDSSSEEEGDESRYRIVDNEKIRAGEIEVGPPEVVRVSDRRDSDDDEEGSYISEHTATGQSRFNPTADDDDRASRTSRRPKSVRITAPDSPVQATAPPALTDSNKPYRSTEQDRAPSPDVVDRPTDAQWNTRIGRLREDTSDESDGDDGYRNARKGVIASNAKWEGMKNKAAVATGLKKKSGGSVKSKSSRAGSARG